MSTTPRPLFAEHEFRKARRSEPNKECVRVARRHGWVEIRDDKTTFGHPDDLRLVFTAAEFDAYLAGERDGQTEGVALEITRRDEDGLYLFRRADGTGGQLVFTDAEVIAFRDGVTKHEFDRDPCAA